MKIRWAEAVLGIGIVIAGGCASSGSPEPASDSSSATSAATQPAAPRQAPDEPPVNTLKWTTASEVDNFGFDVYRSLSEDGPFEKITVEPLPGAGTTDEPQKYVFVDDTIDPSRDYFYYIESISLGGVRERFSPIILAPAKRPTPDSD
jgi:hypothetical protein